MTLFSCVSREVGAGARAETVVMMVVGVVVQLFSTMTTFLASS